MDMRLPKTKTFSESRTGVLYEDNFGTPFSIRTSYFSKITFYTFFYSKNLFKIQQFFLSSLSYWLWKDFCLILK